MRDPRHDILFEPLQIGPVTAKNRFYQVPHCTGMGWRRPNALAAMRGVKAEGGWAVVNTEYCSVHPTSDNEAFPNAALWDDDDVRANAAMVDAVHAHGALAGVELWLAGGMVTNLSTRLPPMGLRNRPQTDYGEVTQGQSRKIDKSDIRDLRRWHREAAVRAVEAGFDIVYVYATHGYLLSEFLDPDTNTRTDEYGGILKNRVRLIRELIEETHEAVAGRAAVATRFTVDLNEPESYDAFGLLADLPDLWDLTVGNYAIEMGHSRFVKEGALVSDVARAKEMTTKPVVAVGRFTSPDTMAQVIRTGAQDMIGSARPSIADPFIPNKINEGRSEDIRECIGCNICYASDSLHVPIRCTQNPTMGEEWRLGWHPEHIPADPEPASVLVVGAGPSGLEAARVLGVRGHRVMLAEATRDLGGRVTREARLPGLSEWARVCDWRVGQIGKLQNVEVFRESRMKAADVLDLGVDHVVIATGARWTTDGIGRHCGQGFGDADQATLLSAEAVLSGDEMPQGHIVIYDDDHYYLGPVIALALAQQGNTVTLVTPQGRACSFGGYTQEQAQTIVALIDAGVTICTNQMVKSVERGEAILACVFTGRETWLSCDAVLPLTRRVPVTDLFDAIQAHPNAQSIQSVTRIGDAEAPSIIAAAVYAGHRAAMDLGKSIDLVARYGKREHPKLD
jgi:dimethylamine/trimethylamine dehydrogenase